MRFAPEAFRSTRVKTTEHVKAALLAARDLRSLDVATLRANPNALSTLRMCTAPPLAVARLVGLAGANKSLIGSMEEGKLASRRKAELLKDDLTKVCPELIKLLDRDIFSWLDTAKDPTEHERDRASTIVADRLCSAVANPIVRNAQEQRQLAMIGDYLDKRGYRKRLHPAGKPLTEMQPATYSYILYPFIPLVTPPPQVDHALPRLEIQIDPVVSIGSKALARYAKKRRRERSDA